MHIDALRIRNFRRLSDVKIDLDPEISIFVGANNSGKTSASQALQLFMAASRDRFSIYEFSANCWLPIDQFGDQVEGAKLPTISLDLWLHVEAADLHRVVDLLPSLNWEGSLVGVRMEFESFRSTVTKRSRASRRGQRNSDKVIGCHAAVSLLWL